MTASGDHGRGREAARALWIKGLGSAEFEDPLTAGFADAALAELEQLQQGTPGVLREVLAGAQMSAEQLNVESFHGLIEVVQNADDLGAKEVRVAVRKRRRKQQLLIAHDGERVRLPHVLSMALAFVSTKRSDPRAKGRFGIGLKTLGRLGERLAVHCAPYHFAISGNSVRAELPQRAIKGFFDPMTTDTLLSLDLREGFDAEEFESWFSGLGSEALLFLDNVRSLRLIHIGQQRARVHHRLAESRSEPVALPGLIHACRRATLRIPGTKRSWERYEVEWPMPQRLRRAHKERSATTPIAIAIPNADSPATQIYAGLPVASSLGLPFSLNAQFDIDVARRGIQHEPLNRWLLSRVADLAASVALERLRRHPARAWAGIPLISELKSGSDSWLNERIEELAQSVQAQVKRGFRLPVRGAENRLRDFTYEAESLDGLIGQHEVDGLRPKLVFLPKASRDRDARWRRVLGELGGAHEIDVSEALTLLDWDDQDLGFHDPRWFIKLARAALERNLGGRLWSQRSVMTTDGTRIVPPMPDEGRLLLRHARDESLAARLKIAHVIDPAYLSRSRDAVIVREWLEENEMLRETPDADATLRALAARDHTDLVEISDEDLRLLRQAFVSVDQEDRLELGLAIGRVIAVDVQRWSSGKRLLSKAAPSDAYLPASIEDRDEGWSRAAGRTPELAWVHPRYRDVMRRPDEARAVRGEARQLAARTFFGLLGAKDAPRLVEPESVETRYGDPATPIQADALAPTQKNQLGALRRHATHLKRDRISPDLVAVLRDIQRDRGLRARRRRARALLSTLDREWSRSYADHTTAEAVFSYGSWHGAGTITATWLAFAIDEPWLTAEDGNKRPPKELAVRTPATEAIFGDDRSAFAYELDESDASSRAVRALGIATDPEISEILHQLEELREKKKPPDEQALALRYAAIAAACKGRDPMPDDMVGDVNVRRLRARFGTQRTKPGLIFAGARWLPPSRVFLGAPIFGNRRPFVSERSAAEKLWRTLRVERPTVSDCIDVLEEIARAEFQQADEQALVNTYLYLEEQLGGASKRERVRLQALPVWTGSTWQKKRPVYSVGDPELARALSSKLPVWQLPVAASAVPGLLEAAGIELLTETAFTAHVHETGFATGATLERHFGRAAELLHDWLTRHDPRLVAALAMEWVELASPRIAVDPALQLELRLARRADVRVAARVHIERDPLMFYFADPDALGEDDAGGAAVASLFVNGDRDKVALAWSRSWARAAKGERGAVTLAEDQENGAALEELFDQSVKGTTMPRRPKATPKRTTPGAAEPGAAQIPARHLKAIEDFGRKTVDVVEGNGGPVVRKRGRRGLRDETPPGTDIRNPKPAPQSAPLAYSEQEKEALALQVLQVAINGETQDLRDYRHLRGVGADALDKLRRYFEIKAHYGAIPDDITLTANEAERAFREGDKFFLAVIGGLEQGYETVVRVFANPLRTLDLKPTTSVTLTGVTGKRSALEVRFPRQGEEQAGTPTADPEVVTTAS
jgi:hypothetical protein